jgi:hypothetical protein
VVWFFMIEHLGKFFRLSWPTLLDLQKGTGHDGKTMGHRVQKAPFALLKSRYYLIYRDNSISFAKNMPRHEHSLRHGPRSPLLFDDKVKYFVNSALDVHLLCQPLAVLWMAVRCNVETF